MVRHCPIHNPRSLRNSVPVVYSYGLLRAVIWTVNRVIDGHFSADWHGRKENRHQRRRRTQNACAVHFHVCFVRRRWAPASSKCVVRHQRGFTRGGKGRIASRHRRLLHLRRTYLMRPVIASERRSVTLRHALFLCHGKAEKSSGDAFCQLVTASEKTAVRASPPDHSFIAAGGDRKIILPAPPRAGGGANQVDIRSDVSADPRRRRRGFLRDDIQQREH